MNFVRWPSAMLLRCLVATSFLFLWASLGFAARPLLLNDAEPIPYQHFQIEAGFRYAGYSDQRTVKHYDIPVNLSYGLVPRLEVGVGIGGQFEQRQELMENHRVSGLADVILGAKWKYAEAEKYWADQALTFGLKLPTATTHRKLGTGRLDGDLTWVVTKPWTKKLATHFNVGYTVTGDRKEETIPDLLHYGVAMEYSLTEKFQLVAEASAITFFPGPEHTGVLIDGGLRYRLTKGLVLDAAIGGGVRGIVPEVIATAGFTWVFGAPWAKK